MRRKATRNLIARVLALLLITVFVAGLALTTTQTSTGLTPTPADNGSPTAPAVVFPPVPAGGTPVVVDYTVFQSTGLLSLPHIVGWDPAPQGAEETALPSGTFKITRAGITFINGTALSVVHAFVERDPDRKTPTVQDLDKYYTKDILDGAWKNFTGGYKELNRRVDGDMFVINFELYLDTNTYLGRQVSRLNNDWLMTLRLVSPNNNPQLLDTLQNTVMPKYRLWPQVLNNVPLTWSAIADGVSGYLIKYPQDWTKVTGEPGKPYYVTGTLGTNSVSLDTRAQPDRTLKSEADARAFVKENWPKSTVQSVKPATADNAQGFAVSYASPDADGNQNSAVVTLLNGSNRTVYAANLTTTARGIDLLDPANSAVPAEFTQIRSSFFLVPPDALTPTLTPTPTVPRATPEATATPPTAGTAPAGTG